MILNYYVDEHDTLRLDLDCQEISGNSHDVGKRKKIKYCNAVTDFYDLTNNLDFCFVLDSLDTLGLDW
jgi:hypothetical protein